jgi:hypothetical protein
MNILDPQHCTVNPALCNCRTCGWRNMVFYSLNHVIMVAYKCMLLVLSLTEITTTLLGNEPGNARWRLTALHRWAGILKSVSIFEKNRKNDKILLVKIVFTDEAIEKTEKSFPALHRWSDKIGCNLWIPLIKRHKFLDKMFFSVKKQYNIPR